MKYRGRPVLAAILGLLTGLFVALDLVFFGVVRLDNIVVTIMPIVGLFAGLLLALWAPLGRKRAAVVTSTVLTLLVLLVSGCGSSSPKAAAGASTTASTQSVRSTTAPSSASSGKPLPAPCTLLTKQDVSPLFGTTALNAIPNQGPVPGTAQCAFSLSVGTQGLGVSVRTHVDYANDPSYVFPQDGKKIAGIGDLAIIPPSQPHRGQVIVKLGKNALDINIEFYDKPVDEVFLTQLAKDAVGRL